LPFARTLLGMGFFSPPRTTPLPCFRTWEPVDAQRMAASEARVLDTINTALSDLGTPPLGRLADLFDLDRDLLCTWPELDHYPQRGADADYLGPILMRNAGDDPVWPPARGPRIFAYLKGDYAGFTPLAKALRASGLAVSIYLQNGSDEQYRMLSSTSLHCHREPVALNAALAAADAVICHAGPSTVAAALLAGKPLLLLPMQAEQYITSQRVVAMGAGLCHVPGFQPLDLPLALRQLVNKPQLAEQARAFAARHAGFDPAQQAELLADRLESVLA
jgi:UDP:flavonoid glycosyltransferase YjiC (YdhE family)